MGDLRRARDETLNLKEKTTGQRFARPDPGAKAMIMMIPLMILGFVFPGTGLRRRMMTEHSHEGTYHTRDGDFVPRSLYPLCVAAFLVTLLLLGLVLFLYYRSTNDELEQNNVAAKVRLEIVQDAKIRASSNASAMSRFAINRDSPI